jgi:cytochrome oxidase Cu insertion factor (SCO1/SenC/PrrC family)
MPYASVKDLPDYVKKYSPNIQRQWMHVWMTVYGETKEEVRAFKAANAVLKKRFKAGQNVSKESHADYFSFLTDKWLGNLRG